MNGVQFSLGAMLDYYLISFALAVMPPALSGLWAWLSREIRVRWMMKGFALVAGATAILGLPMLFLPAATCRGAFIFGYADCWFLPDLLANLFSAVALLSFAVLYLAAAVVALIGVVFEAQRSVARARRRARRSQAK